MVDFRRIFGFRHDLGHAVQRILVLQNAVEDTVLLGGLAELLQILVLHGEYAQLLSASQHRGQPHFPFGALLVFENCIEHNGDLLCGSAGQLGGDLNAV